MSATQRPHRGPGEAPDGVGPRFDVVATGELLIDFVATVSGVTLAEAPAFEKAPGGAPANVAVGLARLGHAVGFLGQVGDDDFGRFLAATLQVNGVDTGGLRFSAAARTALAFVSLRADGEREFMFYRHPSADMLWRPEDVDVAYAALARVIHFGSIALIDEPSRSATLAAIDAAVAAGGLVSYDPNLRPALWPSLEAARAGILLGWARAQIIKVSEEELAFLAGQADSDRAARALWHERLRLLIVTRGAGGCDYYTADHRGHVPGFPVVAIDTTGAGDGFLAGALSGLLGAPLDWVPETIERALRLGNAVGALTTTRRGAIPALPSRAAVEAFLRERGEGGPG